MKDVFICHAYRTPIGITGGCLSTFNAETLGEIVMDYIVKEAAIRPEDIDMIIMGNAVGHGGNIARLAAIKAFKYHAPPSMTIDHQCASSLMAIIQGTSYIKTGLHDLVMVGGLESTSTETMKYLSEKDEKHAHYPSPLKRAPFSSQEVGDPEMLEGAENTAGVLSVARKELDAIALNSHQKAADCDRIDDYVVAMMSPKGECLKDEGIRPRMSMKLLQRLPSLVGIDGVTTTGNACLTHDGAAAMLLASEEAIKRYNLKPLARVDEMHMVSVNPNYSPLGALAAIKKMKRQDFHAIEVNEAFAVKTWSLINAGYDARIINPLGGALAYGHPYGASGAIIAIHSIASLKAGEFGAITMGVAGGQGVALSIERV